MCCAIDRVAPIPQVAASDSQQPLPRGSARGVPLLLGLMGVIGFSLTLTATRVAVPALGGAIVGLGRGVVAAIVAATYLLVARVERPRRADFGSLAIVALGVVLGFPFLSALAMRTLPASHGAVITGLIPASTALMGVWRAGERPTRAFVVACVAGLGSVLVFAIVDGAGRPQPGDVLLLFAAIAAGLGYAEGARLARAWGKSGGVRVISWALVVASPICLALLASVLAVSGLPHFGAVSASAWTGFGYVSTVSAYLAFFPWYAALARGGVARIGQIQLLQPVMGVAWAALLLGETVSGRTVLAALLVMACAAAALRL
ncbi:MAG: DMT family transporter [Gemmatimonadota bacterium]|nr:DMT family transporter [Gemmatimonadota bacterium]